MNKSESIAEILKALSGFQFELDNVGKDKAGHGYKYATLGACINAAKEPLKNHGLSVIQLIGDINGAATIETILGHLSGEYISSVCIIPLAKLAGSGASNPAQIMGASITYMRRYQYAAILGMAQEDDDAASATKGNAHRKPSNSSTTSNIVDVFAAKDQAGKDKMWPTLSNQQQTQINNDPRFK